VPAARPAGAAVRRRGRPPAARHRQPGPDRRRPQRPPEDRRGIIEEAAGVLKYRKRKEKAERRLDATEANLLRLQDLLREVRRQLRPLERQAEAARRHEVLVRELGELRIFVAGREITTLRRKLESIEVDRLGAAEAEAELKSTLARLDTEVMSLEAQLSARGANDISDRLVHVEQLRERARGLAGILAERSARSNATTVPSSTPASSPTSKPTPRSSEPSSTRCSSRSTRSHPTPRRSRPTRKRSAPSASGSPRPSRPPTTAAPRRRAQRPRCVVSCGRSATASSAPRANLRRATTKSDEVRVKLERLAEESDRLRGECAAAESVETPLVDQIEEAEQARLAAEAAFERLTAERHAASDLASRSNARVEALQLALDAARERAGAERLADVEGVLGTLLDLVDIDAGWQEAVEAALGEALTAVVVDGSQTARLALDALRDSGTSGAVLAVGTRATSPTAPAVGEAVRPHVRPCATISRSARRARWRGRVRRRPRHRGRRRDRTPHRRDRDPRG
jgi:chromosome segregation protein